MTSRKRVHTNMMAGTGKTKLARMMCVGKSKTCNTTSAFVAPLAPCKHKTTPCYRTRPNGLVFDTVHVSTLEKIVALWNSLIRLILWLSIRLLRNCKFPMYGPSLSTCLCCSFLFFSGDYLQIHLEGPYYIWLQGDSSFYRKCNIL